MFEDFIHSIEDGYFLQWEAVVREEKGLPLSKKQQEALSQLISFEDEDDETILYIDEIPRPCEPWYEILRKIVPHFVPVDLQHKLWMQHCYDEVLDGLGQEEVLTLENEGQQHRIEWFANHLKEHKESVQFLDLTLAKLLDMVILPKRDEKIFIRMMKKKLELRSVNKRIADVL